MFRSLIEEGKRQPDFAGTDDHQVSVTLYGEIQNPQFLRFLEKVGQEKQVSFVTADLIALDYLQRRNLCRRSLGRCFKDYWTRV